MQNEPLIQYNAAHQMSHECTAKRRRKKVTIKETFCPRQLVLGSSFPVQQIKLNKNKDIDKQKRVIKIYNTLTSKSTEEVSCFGFASWFAGSVCGSKLLMSHNLFIGTSPLIDSIANSSDFVIVSVTHQNFSSSDLTSTYNTGS